MQTGARAFVKVKFSGVYLSAIKIDLNPWAAEDISIV